jgi:hypothetical protein
VSTAIVLLLHFVNPYRIANQKMYTTIDNSGMPATTVEQRFLK